MSEELGHYTSRGARALVLLHEAHLRQCIQVWKQAKASGLGLPASDNKNYQSLYTLLQHVLCAARNYMLSMCRILNLPDPQIDPVPELPQIGAEMDRYLEHLLEHWRLPLADVTDDQMEPPEELYVAGMPYWIDAMLEHAVMHPIRHEFQLRELMEQPSTSAPT